MAFEIMWSLGKGQEARSLENFQAYIDGVEQLRRYKDMRADADFREAERHLLRAIDDNPGYVKAVFYLGTLYAWRVSYAEGNPRLAETSASNAHGRYLTLTARHASEDAQALGHFGFGLLHYRRYQWEQRLSATPPGAASPSDPLLGEAAQHFTRAMTLDPSLHFATTGFALTYKERGCLDQALSAFQQARARVDCRLSAAWIEKQVQVITAAQQRETPAIAHGGEPEGQRAPRVASAWGLAEPKRCP